MDQAIQTRPSLAQFRLQKMHRQLERCRHWRFPPPYRKQLAVVAAVWGNCEAAQPVKPLAKRVERAALRVRSKRRCCRFSSMLITYSSATASKNSDILVVYQFALT